MFNTPKFSAGCYSRLAKSSVDEIINQDKLPLLVGGGLLWMDWIISGVMFLVNDPHMRNIFIIGRVCNLIGKIPYVPKAIAAIEKAVGDLIRPYEQEARWDEVMNEILVNVGRNGDTTVYNGIPK